MKSTRFSPSLWMRPERLIDLCQVAQPGRGGAGIGSCVSVSRACSRIQSRTLAICASAVSQSPSQAPVVLWPASMAPRSGPQPTGGMCRGLTQVQALPGSRQFVLCTVWPAQECGHLRGDPILPFGLGQVCLLRLVLTLFSRGCCNKHPILGGYERQKRDSVCLGSGGQNSATECRWATQSPVALGGGRGDPCLLFQLLVASESPGLWLSLPDSGSVFDGLSMSVSSLPLPALCSLRSPHTWPLLMVSGGRGGTGIYSKPCEGVTVCPSCSCAPGPEGQLSSWQSSRTPPPDSLSHNLSAQIQGLHLLLLP